MCLCPDSLVCLALNTQLAIELNIVTVCCCGQEVVMAPGQTPSFSGVGAQCVEALYGLGWNRVI